MDQNQDFFTMKNVVEITALSEHNIRKWIKEFNIQVHETDGGHRRFTQETVDKLLLAKKKRDQQGWSIKDIRNFFNGELSNELKDQQIDSREHVTALEKRLQNMEEKLDTTMQINQQLISALKEKEQNEQQTLQTILEHIDAKFEDENEKRDRQLMLELRKTQEEIAASNLPKKKKWLSFFKKD